MTEIILLAYDFASMIVRGGVRIAMVGIKPTLRDWKEVFQQPVKAQPRAPIPSPRPATRCP